MVPYKEEMTAAVVNMLLTKFSLPPCKSTDAGMIQLHHAAEQDPKIKEWLPRLAKQSFNQILGEKVSGIDACVGRFLYCLGQAGNVGAIKRRSEGSEDHGKPGATKNRSQASSQQGNDEKYDMINDSDGGNNSVDQLAAAQDRPKAVNLMAHRAGRMFQPTDQSGVMRQKVGMPKRIRASLRKEVARMEDRGPAQYQVLLDQSG